MMKHIQAAHEAQQVAGPLPDVAPSKIPTEPLASPALKLVLDTEEATERQIRDKQRALDEAGRLARWD